MRFLKAALRLPLITLMVVYCIRWAAIRLRRILLRSTDDSTPPIEQEQVIPQMRRVIISDLHLGAGDRLDDFDADAELSTFIHRYVAGTEPTELILAGDSFEFLQVRLPDLSDFEWSGEAAAQRLGAIIAAHAGPIAALRVFLDQPAHLRHNLIRRNRRCRVVCRSHQDPPKLNGCPSPEECDRHTQE